MILGIDASQANRKIRSGTEWYAFYLIQEFKKLLLDRTDVRVRLYLRDAPQADLANNLPENFEFKVLNWPLRYFWGQIRLSWEMLIDPPDILFCPAHTIPLIHPGSELPLPLFGKEGSWRGVQGRTFTTLHDVGFEDYPELYDKLSLWYHKWAARLAVKHAYYIFTISQFSKERIVENYQCDPSRITVTPLGIDPNFATAQNGSIESTLKNHGLVKGSYLLFVGRLEPKKNILGIVEAYDMFLSSLRVRRRRTKQSQSDEEIVSSPSEADPRNDRNLPDMVLAGRRVRTSEVDEYLKSRPYLKSKVRFLGYLDEEDKGALYKGAIMFLFPTLYEGFGLPILEAQACGTPVITSNTASNPEIAGAGAVIVDPESPNEIAAAIRELLTNKNLREEKVRKGLENVKRFSWRETANSTLKTMGIVD